MNRRPLWYAVLLCLVGAGLALFAATRTWTVETITRSAPLPSLRVERTGADLLPWLPALAVVGLAGAGAVLATRGVGRRVIGALLLVVGLALSSAGAIGLTWDLVASAWPVGCLLGGLLAAVGGTLTVARGPAWPVMGARYERTGGPAGGAAPTGDHPVTCAIPAGTAPMPPGGADADNRGAGAAADDRGVGRRTIEAWDALDRGEDPTTSY